MKIINNFQRAFFIPLLIAIIAVLVIGGGIYIYESEKMNEQEANSKQPSLTLVSPNGGETYKKGDTVNIRWNTENISSTIDINLLKADGSIVYNLVSQLDPQNGSQVDSIGPSYSWWVPTDNGPGGRKIDAGTYKIQIIVPGYNDEGRGVADASDNYFTVTNASITSQTSDWKTYTNSKYRFTFNYPSSWKYKEFDYNVEGIAFCPQ
ncbi:MAG: hypothetical protein WCW14_02305, partial [Candidatus Paceibacterota bacterium]